MSELISRKAFLDFIESVPFLLEHQNLKTIVIDWIKQQSTAYDVDKVVEELEEKRWEAKEAFEEMVLDDAIEIVKGGGVDGTN